jgi:hypothetical protein
MSAPVDWREYVGQLGQCQLASLGKGGGVSCLAMTGRRAESCLWLA